MRMKQIFLTDTLTEKFRASYAVDPATGCWNWTGTMEGYEPHQYPSLEASVEGKRTRYKAHRYSYTLSVGTIPEGLTLDHECVNPPCVNPAHLKPVTHEENCRLSGVRQTHCKYGHEFTPDNLVPDSARSGAKCRRCQRNAGRARGLGITIAQYNARQDELDPNYARTPKPAKPPRDLPFIKLDWSKPVVCLNCSAEMRHYTEPADSRPKHASRGICKRCY